MSENSNPVIAVAKKSRGSEITLSTGVRAILTPVASALLDEAANGVPAPIVPSIEDLPDHPGRFIENPNDPDYQKALGDYERRRSQTLIDAVVMFGVKLLEEIPPVGEWLPQLEFLSRRGVLDLKAYDLTNPLELEFVFKKYIAVGTDDVNMIVGATTVTAEAISSAEASFQRHKE